MTTLRTPSRTAAVLAAGALTLSACSGFGPFGSSQVTEPADIDRPDVGVDIHEGAACDSIPENVLDRHAPDAEPHSLDSEELLDAEPTADGYILSSCAWAEGDPTLHLRGPSDTSGGTEILVNLYAFSDPQRASEAYDFMYDVSVRPDGTTENGRVYGPVHEIAIGDQGFLQHRRTEDEPAVTDARAQFIAGDAVVQIFIVRGVADPWTEDEILAALSDIVAAFGT